MRSISGLVYSDADTVDMVVLFDILSMATLLTLSVFLYICSWFSLFLSHIFSFTDAKEILLKWNAKVDN